MTDLIRVLIAFGVTPIMCWLIARSGPQEWGLPPQDFNAWSDDDQE